MRLVIICCLFSLWQGLTIETLAAMPQEILLGQSSAFSGGAQDIGNEMRVGLQAAFARVNEAGGIAGRPIRLISRDDGYEPDRAVRNSEIFIEEDRVFALIGQVGTPTSQAVLPLASRLGIPFFAPLTGAAFLRTPFNPYVITIRASYAQEMAKIVNYLINEKKLSRIACFYQNDSYGFDGLKGLEQALGNHGMKLVAQASYERNTVAVMGAVLDIEKVQPEAVVMVGAYTACAEFIKLSKAKMHSQALFASISFVGTESLRDSLGEYGQGVIVSQVVPNPYDNTLPLVGEYKESMSLFQHGASTNFNSFEGYIAGRLFAAICQNISGEFNQKSFIETMERVGSFDLGGLILRFAKTDHQGLDDVFLTEIYPKIREIKMAGQ
ncbi:ABC transporter substrate-binding protein [Desulfotalea psychrophila]|nr:ABC transporter substrate-binding protein [Desulfotalea psychrophila]